MVLFYRIPFFYYISIPEQDLGILVTPKILEISRKSSGWLQALQHRFFA